MGTPDHSLPEPTDPARMAISLGRSGRPPRTEKTGKIRAIHRIDARGRRQ
jgi:hypothetical protein